MEELKKSIITALNIYLSYIDDEDLKIDAAFERSDINVKN